MDNSVALPCTFQGAVEIPRFCCVHMWSSCSGCNGQGQANGKCSSVQQTRMKWHKDNGKDGYNNGTKTPCCDGSCCARWETECDTCSRDSCDSNNNCHTEYYDCNCRQVCRSWSSQEGHINCGMCHDYEVDYTFMLDGLIHKKALSKQTCSLHPQRGDDHPECWGATKDKFKKGQQQQCWVNKKTMDVYWEEPSLNAGRPHPTREPHRVGSPLPPLGGCIVGLVIGGLMMLVSFFFMPKLCWSLSPHLDRVDPI
jgi:hypothetical protein